MAKAPTVLNVGGHTKRIDIGERYAGWEHILLDIDARPGVDIVKDARALTELPAETYDAVYCSHTLEHFFAHDIPRVLAGFLHVLKPDGFVEIRVPDLGAVVAEMARRNLDLDDTLYTAAGNPILVRDIIFGWSRHLRETGHDYYAHKTGFTARSLHKALAEAGFATFGVFKSDSFYELAGFAFKRPTSQSRVEEVPHGPTPPTQT